MKFENVDGQNPMMPSMFVVFVTCICMLFGFYFVFNLEEILEEFFTVLRWGKLKVSLSNESMNAYVTEHVQCLYS